jgi:hypothetical protein
MPSLIVRLHEFALFASLSPVTWGHVWGLDDHCEQETVVIFFQVVNENKATPKHYNTPNLLPYCGQTNTGQMKHLLGCGRICGH